MDNFPENNNRDNEFATPAAQPTPPELPPYPFDKPKKPWLTVRDVRPEKGYNPYLDESSVFNEIREENPTAFRGAEHLPEENEYQYQSRRWTEYSFAKKEAAKKLRNSSAFASLLVMIFVLMGLGLQVIAVFIIPTLSSNMEGAALDRFYDLLNYVLNGIQYLVIFPLIFLIGTIGIKCKCKTFFHKPHTSPVFTFRWCIISLGVTYIVAIVFDTIFQMLQDMGMHVNDLSSPLPTKPFDLVIYGFFTVICAPLFEEIMFRGIMLNRLKKFGGVFASVISGVLFGLIHQNHQQMFFASALGIIFAIMALKSRSIIPSIIAHAAVNGYSFLNTIFAAPTNYNDVMFGDGSVTELAGPTWALFGMNLMNFMLFLFMGAAVVLLIVEFIVSPSTFKLSKGDSMLSAGEKSKAFFSSPVVILCLILLAGVIYLNSFLSVDAIANYIESIMSALPETSPVG